MLRQPSKYCLRLVNKKETIMKHIYILAIFMLVELTSVASHISGGDITYKCIGPNQYEFTVKLFRDCEGIDAPTSLTVYFDNDCGMTDPAGVSCARVINPNTGQDHTDISQLCAADIQNSTCNGGSLPGMELYEYRGTVTFPGACDSWTIYYTTCCRNAAIVNLDDPDFYGTHLSAKINSVTSPCNSSADFTAHPIPYVCVNIPVNYNFGVVEPDGDSVVYSFIDATESYPATNLTYMPGYSPTNPIQGINLDPTTGQLTFTPTTLGNFVVVVKATEYDVNGNIVGETFRDIQFVVQNCNNQVVDAATLSITNSTGDGNITAQKEFQACEGDNFCFDIVIQDPDAGDSLFVTSNIQNILPNATLTYTGVNPITATLCGTVQGGANTFNVINFDVRDNACPVVGLATFSVVLRVIKSTATNQDTTICAGDSMQFNVTGGSTFSWQSISGDPIVVGTNFSCNNCPNPIANPSTTTTYVVTSDLTGGCSSTDTVTITVAPNFTYQITQSSTASCQATPIDFEIIPTPAGNYTYDWTPGDMLSDSTSPNPTMTPTRSGLLIFDVSIESDLGCLKMDQLQVNVSQGVKPGLTAVSDVDTAKCNAVVNLTAEVDSATAILDLEEDFDQPNPGPLWSNLSGVSITNSCDTRNGSAGSLLFDDESNDRIAQTVPLQGNACATLEFWLKPASGGSGTCNSPETVDNLLLEYSNNGGTTWFPMRTYTVSTWGTATSAIFQFQSVPIPASTTPITIRFIQPVGNYTSGAYDYWILDDVKITCSSFANFTYSWEPSAAVSNPYAAMTTSSPDTGTTYTVIVTDTTSGCADTSDVFVAVANEFPDVQFEADTLAGCYPLNVTFTNTTDPARVGSVLWEFGYNNLTSTQTPVTSPVVYDSPGVYDVKLTVTSPSGCVSDTTIQQMISVFGYPTADFQVGPQPTNVLSAIMTFSDLSSSDVVQWSWDFGIDDPDYVDSSSVQNPVIQYPDKQGGDYDIQLIVTNGDGCSDTISRSIIIDDLFAMYVPNAFTPDYDGVNDEFLPTSPVITENGYEFTVFDRWGDVIFNSIVPGEAWDGKKNGQLLPSGIYVWKLKSIDPNTDERYIFRGHILSLH